MTQEVSDRFWQAEGRLKGRKDGSRIPRNKLKAVGY